MQSKQQLRKMQALQQHTSTGTSEVRVQSPYTAVLLFPQAQNRGKRHQRNPTQATRAATEHAVLAIIKNTTCCACPPGD
jgi:hypothetical protein